CVTAALSAAPRVPSGPEPLPFPLASALAARPPFASFLLLSASIVSSPVSRVCRHAFVDQRKLGTTSDVMRASRLGALRVPDPHTQRSRAVLLTGRTGPGGRTPCCLGSRRRRRTRRRTPPPGRAPRPSASSPA